MDDSQSVKRWKTFERLVGCENLKETQKQWQKEEIQKRQKENIIGEHLSKP